MPFASLSVMVVDDDPIMVRVLAETLRGMGVGAVTTHTDPNAAMRILGDGDTQIDVLLCDLNMPEMDGFELLRHLNESAFRGGVVLVSGEDPFLLRLGETLGKEHHLRLLGVIQKPATRPLLEEVLSRYHSTPSPKSAAPRMAPPTGDELREAIAGAQIVPYYQPKVCTRTGVVTGAEALARWLHPTRGVVPPGLFIPLAEELGLINDLTASILEQAIAQAGRWHALGRDFKTAINLSVDTLGDLLLPRRIDELIREHGTPATSIVLEITEGRVMARGAVTLEVLTRLALKGMTISVDDFGTGYSTLEQLRRAPFRELKVDRAFVHGAGPDPGLRAIFESSVELARKLGMRVVAEGVEDQADWDVAAALECDEVQGYFVARPMPVDEFDLWFASWS